MDRSSISQAMKFIPIIKRKYLDNLQIKQPWPKARVVKQQSYESYDGSYEMILELGDIVEITGRHGHTQYSIIIPNNHKGESEELLIDVDQIEPL